MYKLTINEKEYKVKFGYKPVLKEKIISRFNDIRKVAEGVSSDNQYEVIENMLLFLPELLLVGLQVYHYDEFGYDYDDKNDKESKVEKVMELLDEYAKYQDSDLVNLITELEKELTSNSFLSSVLRNEESAQAAEEVMETVEPKKTTTTKKTTVKKKQ